MPVTIKKTKKGYRVSTPHGVKAKHTTKQKAMAQANLLRGIEHGWKPTGKPKHNPSIMMEPSGGVEKESEMTGYAPCYSSMY